MDKERLKDALITIMVGAIVAFLTSLVDGLANLLYGHFDSTVGAATSSAMYGYKHLAGKFVSMYYIK